MDLFRKSPPPFKPKKPAAPPAQTFGSAFAAARKSGLKVFEYKGKKYTTELKKETPRPAAPIAKMEPKPAQIEFESKEPVIALS